MEGRSQTMGTWLIFNRENFDFEQNLCDPRDSAVGEATSVPPQCKINVLRGIAATEKAKEILLSELHRWWVEKKSFWGKQRENLKNPHNPGEPETDWVDPLSPSPQMYCSWSCFFLERFKKHGETLCSESLILFNKGWKEVSIIILACRNLEPSKKQDIHCSKISYTLLLPSLEQSLHIIVSQDEIQCKYHI